MKTAYERITAYDGTTEDFRKFLRQHGFDKVFGTLYEIYDSARLIKQIVDYIVQCYSLDSDFVMKGASWIDVKETVARHVGLPSEVHNLIVYLGNYETYEVRKKKEPKNTEEAEAAMNEEEQLQDDPDTIWEGTDSDDLPINKVVQVINRWLDFQNYREWKHLAMLQDQYEEMMVASQQKLMKSGGGIDFDTKAKCRQHAANILNEIEEMERKIRDRDPALIKEAKKEIKYIRPESLLI